MPETETTDGWSESKWGLPAAAERKLAYAAVMGLGRREPVSEADIDKVEEWAVNIMHDTAIMGEIVTALNFDLARSRSGRWGLQASRRVEIRGLGRVRFLL